MSSFPEMYCKGHLFIISKRRKTIFNFFCQNYLKGSYLNRTRTKNSKPLIVAVGTIGAGTVSTIFTLSCTLLNEDMRCILHS